MTRILRDSVHEVLTSNGFVRYSGKYGLFLIGEARTVTPAFYCLVLRKRGEVRLGGGIGLFFSEFERTWAASLSMEDRRNDATLPLIMLIDNYPKLIEGGVLKYSGIPGVEEAARQLYDFVRRLPDTIESFSDALSRKNLLGIQISEYLHIFDYHDSDNLYFRKSKSFVYWFIEAYPQLTEQLCQCLSHRQRQRLGLSNFG